uniref:hypothetical protein n=1 Tax=Clostridium sp. 12(A) TaxID=1163671 RepID=UPI0004671EB0|nr:hypothetical protein [Clostridium sp. 12(A)]
MTRRNIIFKDKNTGKLYVSPEFNGDKREIENRGFNLDSYYKNWDEILNDFIGIMTLYDFKMISRKVQRYGSSFLGEVEILPVTQIHDIGQIENDEVYLLYNGIIKRVV